MPTYTFSLNREQVIKKALGKCKAIGAGENPNGDDYELAADSLDLILKEMPARGLGWFHMDPSVDTVTLAIGTTRTFAVPASYGGEGVLFYLDADSKRRPMRRLDYAEYIAIDDKAGDAQLYPDWFYRRNDGYIEFGPQISAQLSGELEYRKAVADSVVYTAPDVPAYMQRCLIYMLAFDMADDFPVEATKRREWGDIIKSLWPVLLAYNAGNDQGQPAQLTVRE